MYTVDRDGNFVTILKQPVPGSFVSVSEVPISDCDIAYRAQATDLIIVNGQARDVGTVSDTDLVQALYDKGVLK